MKVYTLINEWSFDFETGHNVRTFDTLGKAKAALKEAFDTFFDGKEHGVFTEEEFEETYASYSEEGRWSENHSSWTIHESELECKKVFALFQTDVWHSLDSRVLFCICESVRECVELLWKEHGEEQDKNEVLCTEEMRDELLSSLQTQGSERGYEFDIYEYEMNKMFE